MPGGTRELLLSLETTYAADSAELESLVRTLRGELLDTDVADVQPVTAGAPPGGAKAMDAFAWNALRLFLDPAILSSVFSTLTSWVRRNEGTALHLAAGDCVVELKGAIVDSAALQKMLETCLEAREESQVAADDADLSTVDTDAVDDVAKAMGADVEPGPAEAPPVQPAADPAAAPEPEQPPPAKEGESVAEPAATPDPQEREDEPEEP